MKKQNLKHYKNAVTLRNSILQLVSVLLLSLGFSDIEVIIDAVDKMLIGVGALIHLISTFNMYRTYKKSKLEENDETIE